MQRPEGITIEYAHEQFTVREHVFVPLDLPAVVVLLEVDALRPMEIVDRVYQQPLMRRIRPEGQS